MFTLSGFADEISPKLEDQVALLKKLGVKYLELRSIGGKNVSDFTDQEALGYKKVLDENGLKISAIGSPIGKIKASEPFEPHLEKHKRVLRMAEIFDTPLIRAFSFYVSKEMRQAMKPVVLKRMNALLDATPQGVRFQLENEEGLFAESPKGCLELVTALNRPNLRMTFDFANFALLGYDTRKAWQSLAPQVTYFHIKDAISEPRQIVPAGEGQGHLPEILHEAQQHGFSGFLSLEPHLNEARKDGGFSGESNFSRAHRALVKVLKSIGADFN
jgi:sugar phosphate isomerase/epimerase